MEKKVRNRLREIGRTVPTAGQASQGIKSRDLTRVGRFKCAASVGPSIGFVAFFLPLKTQGRQPLSVEIASLMGLGPVRGA